MKNPADVAVACGIVLRRLRKDAGLTQEQLALEADLQRSYVSILELGQQQPSLTTILKLASALGCTAQSLMGEIEDEVKKSV